MKLLAIAMLVIAAAYPYAVRAETEPVDAPCALGVCMGEAITAPAAGVAQGVTFAKLEHPAFDAGVTVYHTPATGVCKIKGLHIIRDPDSYGNDIKAAHKRFVGLVEKKYGEGRTTDSLRKGSIWNKPNDWLMSLRRDERTLDTIWQTLESAKADARSAL